MYLTEDSNLEYVLDKTGLSLAELEEIVGRFDEKHHAWPNKLKGEYVENWDGEIKIIHHFTKKTLWEG